MRLHPTRTRTAVVVLATGLLLGLVTAPLTTSTALGATSARTGSQVSADWPARQVRLDRAAYVSGTVPRQWRNHAVALQRKAPNGWQTVASRRISGRDYRLRMPTGWLSSYRYRVTAVGNGLVTSSSRRMTVVTPYRPQGRTDDHTFMSNPSARWNPCQTIRYAVNPAGIRGALHDAREAVDRIASATGLRFHYTGTTRFVPQAPGDTPAGADLVIAWARPATSRMLGDSPASAGVGGPRWTSGRALPLQITAGAVVINSLLKPTPGFAEGRFTRGELLMHEIGHAVGLGHARTRSQVMYPVMVPTSRWGAGDLTALRQVGAQQGCGDPSARLTRRATTSASSTGSIVFD